MHKGAKNKEQRTENKYTLKSGVLLTVLACKSSQQLFSLWSRWMVFLLYVYGDVVSSWCCCWVVGRYTGIPYIDSCPVPACHGLVLVVLACHGFLEMLYRSVLVNLRWSLSQLPDLLEKSWNAHKWSPHPPLAQSAASDLESEAEVWFPPRLVWIAIYNYLYQKFI